MSLSSGTRKFPFVTLTLLCLTVALLPLPSSAQSYQVLYTFHHNEGSSPGAGVTMDGAGRLYGTAALGGNVSLTCLQGCGLVFQLAQRGSGWVLNPLYKFTGGADGANPEGRVLFGPGGLLYGTAGFGGMPDCGPLDLYPQGCGTVFTLRPSATACHTALCPWMQTVIHTFDFGDGAIPGADLNFDHAGNLFGTTFSGGFYGCENDGCGVVYELSPVEGGWSESVPYYFTTGFPGFWPVSGAIVDPSGNLFATTSQFGSVLELTPSGGGWIETTLPQIPNSNFNGGLVRDAAGNLYGGSTSSSPPSSIFEYSPNGSGWTVTTLHTFPQNTSPNGSLTLDAAGNLYGVTGGGTHGYGEVFKLTHAQGTWTYTALYDFTGASDGGRPNGSVILDANGNIFGTAAAGGDLNSCRGGCGVVWEITPQ